MRTDRPGTPLPRLLGFLAVLASVTAVAAAAAPSLKVYFAADFKDQAYQRKTYAKVAAKWKMPSDLPKPGSKTVVITAILKDGSLGETLIHYKSGSEAWDAAALQAVKAAAPFDPLPGKDKTASAQVHFHFEYGP